MSDKTFLLKLFIYIFMKQYYTSISINVSDIRKMISESVRKITAYNCPINERVSKGFWNRETCYNEAKKYKSRVEFARQAQRAYQIARINGWLNDYNWFLPNQSEKKWNRETCRNEAKKYKSRAEFQHGSQHAYAVALKNGWLDDYDWFKTKMRPHYWTRETCYDEAKKYTSRAEFAKNSCSAYDVALKNGWLDDYTWFKNRPINEKNIYVVYCYKDEETNSVYIGLTNNLKKRHKQHCNGFLRHGKVKYDTVYRYFHSLGKEPPEPTVLEKDLLANEAQIYEDLYIEQYKNDGYNVLNIAKAGSLGGYGKWDKESCHKEAQKYNSRWDFGKNSPTAYLVALKNGWINDYTWFKPKGEGRRKWTFESCYNEAKKYKSRIEFAHNNDSAYRVALKNGWLDDYTWFSSKYANQK